jgi:hypothetical protein
MLLYTHAIYAPGGSFWCYCREEQIEACGGNKPGWSAKPLEQHAHLASGRLKWIAPKQTPEARGL